MDADLEVEMELVYEWVADAEDDHLAAWAEALEHAWFTRDEETLHEIEDAPARPSLGGRLLRLIAFA
jgi:hypothetical protein